MKEMQNPVVIIGAGICGLTLAHGLKKAGIPFEIYERDIDVDAREQGWAITLHWVLPFLEKLLEPEVYRGLDSIQVDPEVGRNDTGNFLFINLATEEAKFRIPPNGRRRVGREKMRKLLLEGVEKHVRWGKKIVDINVSESEDFAVAAAFDDGSRATASLLVGAEGTNSPTRKFLLPEAYQTYQLPVRFVGVAIDLTAEEVKPLRDLDPLLFQGSHPDTGTFLWVSMLEVPTTNGTAGTANERFRVQINLSWLVKEESDEVARTDAEKLAQMKQKATGMAPKLLKVILDIPQGTPVTQIKLADWPCVAWDNRGGRVTLAGDAAHAMTMYRGEAANHGILDVYHLVQSLQTFHDGKKPQKQALEEYESELRQRTNPAVLLSRQACLDAHDFNGLDRHSAVLKQRAINTKDL